MGFRTKFGWGIIHIFLVIVLMAIAIIEFVVAVIGFVPALIINRYPRWAKFPITRLMFEGINTAESISDKPFIFK